MPSMMSDDAAPNGRQQPAVSVILANYNSASFVEASLRSILTQERVDLEVLLVDDVSTDGGLEIARRIAEADARLRVFTMSKNGGPAAARNQALSLARGRWVAIVDSDDLLHPHRFAELIVAAEAADVDIVADDLLVFTDKAATPPRRFLKPHDQKAPFRIDLGEYLRRSVLYSREPNPGFLKPMIRRDRLEASGLRYDESLRIAEDDDFVVRLLLAGLTYLVVPTPWYFYRKHGGSISHRLNLPAIEAMVAADARLSQMIMRERPALAGACATRRRAFERAAAFEAVIAAVRRRDPSAVVRLAARNPSVLPMLRMPLAGLIGKLTRPSPHNIITHDEQQQQLLAIAAQSDAPIH